MENVFNQQDAFVAKMVKAYDQGVINEVYKPYIDWKQGKSFMPSQEEVANIKEILTIELNYYYDKYPEAYKEVDLSVYLGEYKGYKEDADVVAILEAIDAELLNLQFVAQ